MSLALYILSNFYLLKKLKNQKFTSFNIFWCPTEEDKKAKRYFSLELIDNCTAVINLHILFMNMGSIKTFSEIFGSLSYDLLGMAIQYMPYHVRLDLNENLPSDKKTVLRLSSQKFHREMQVRKLFSRMIHSCGNTNAKSKLLECLLETPLLEKESVRNAAYFIASKCIRFADFIFQLTPITQIQALQREKISSVEKMKELSELLQKNVTKLGINEAILPHLDLYFQDISLYVTLKAPAGKTSNDFPNISNEAKVVIDELSMTENIVSVIEEVSPSITKLEIVSFLDGGYTYWQYVLLDTNEYTEFVCHDIRDVADFFNISNPNHLDLILQDEGFLEYAVVGLLLFVSRN